MIHAEGQVPPGLSHGELGATRLAMSEPSIEYPAPQERVACLAHVGTRVLRCRCTRNQSRIQAVVTRLFLDDVLIIEHVDLLRGLGCNVAPFDKQASGPE